MNTSDIWTILIVIFCILGLVGLIMGIVVISKDLHTKFPSALHIIMTIFFAPLEIIFAGIELTNESK